MEQKRGGIFRSLIDVVLLLVYVVYAYYHLLYRYIFPKRLKSLDGEVILVTGSGSGIGRELVYNLARNHPKASLVLWDFNSTANQHTVDSVKLLGVDVFSYTVDITDREQVEECARRVLEEVGYVTLLINNAGVVGVGDLLTQPADKIAKTMDVNVLSHFWILRAFLPEMIEQNYGHIVTTCSMVGHVGIPFDAPYVASKFAVRGYLESLKLELQQHPQKPKIRFTTIFPSFVNTPLLTGISYKFKFQFLFNALEPRHVADKILEGVRRNEESVFVPKFFELFVFFKRIMPARAFQRLQTYLFESVQFSEERIKLRVQNIYYYKFY